MTRRARRSPWSWVKNMTMKPTMAQAKPAMPSQVIGMSCHDGSVPAILRSCLIFTAQAQRKKAQNGASTRASIRRTTRMKTPGRRQAPAVRMKWRFFSIPAVAPQM